MWIGALVLVISLAFWLIWRGQVRSLVSQAEQYANSR